MKQLLLIVNPKAGRGTTERNLSSVISMLSSNGYMTTVYYSQNRGDARRVAQECTEQFETVVCSGGDGTLEEVVAGVIAGGNHSRIGYIPAGSTNDFAYTLSISPDPKKAVYTLIHGEDFPCDVGLFNGKVFIYVAAFGAFTDVSYRTDQDLKNVIGHGAYILEGARSLFDLKPFPMRLTFNGQTMEGEFLYGMISNSRSVGGIRNMIPEDIGLDDGEFEILLIRKPETTKDWEVLITAMVSRQPDGNMMFLGRSEKVQCYSHQKIAWTLDGENGGIHSKCEIINQKQKIRIIRDRKESE